MLGSRNTEQIRADALKTAIRKAALGCNSCAQGYFELAKKHGATDEEISRAITDAGNSGAEGISRRRLLQLAVAVAAGATLGLNELLPRQARASGYYWGTDSNSATMLEIPQDFYVGRFGYGTIGSPFFFNVSAAQTAGKNGTYMYWGLEGPGHAPPGMTYYSWGQQQASVALDQHLNNPHAAFVGGYTIFADIESGFGGWAVGSAAYSSNQQVVQGFLDGIAAAYTKQTPFRPGIYINPNDWINYVGIEFRPPEPFVLWIAGVYACNHGICAPCNDTCWTTLTTVESLLPAVTSTILGGSKALLWQYWLDPPCGCGDFNVAIQDPGAGFKPVSSQQTFSLLAV